jgi:two-component system, chemotaxis family, protein-glutamate methylesterase/glutaminase
MAEEQLNRKISLLVIGGSAGSLDVIMQFLAVLPPPDRLAIIIVVHRKNADSILVELLSGLTTWTVKEAEEKEPIEAGTIYLAPPDYHLLIEMDKTLSLDFSEKVHYSRPSIDVSFETAAEAYGTELACLLLSGANADGVEGLKAVHHFGGITLVQDPEEATVSYMPRMALEELKVDKVIKLKDLGTLAAQLNQGRFGV